MRRSFRLTKLRQNTFLPVSQLRCLFYTLVNATLLCRRIQRIEIALPRSRSVEGSGTAPGASSPSPKTEEPKLTDMVASPVGTVKKTKASVYKFEEFPSVWQLNELWLGPAETAR
jgi:hypothetical protein